MKDSIYQLLGEHNNELGLFHIPEEMFGDDIQEKFDEAFKAFNDDELSVGDVAEYLSDKYGIERFYIDEWVYTDRI